MSDFSKIQHKLEARLLELSERAEDIDDDLREPHDDDWAENATESADEETLEKIGDMAMTEIDQIKLALSNIKSGTYGKCSKCSGKIAIARLEAVPHANTCIKCV